MSKRAYTHAIEGRRKKSTYRLDPVTISLFDIINKLRKSQGLNPMSKSGMIDKGIAVLKERIEKGEIDET